MAVFSNANGMGIDLGSSNLTVSLPGEGVVLREPDCVLVDSANDEEVLAVGREARGMMGRTPAGVMLLSPVVDGAVTDEKLVTEIVAELGDKALGNRRPFERSRLCVTFSPGATKVERRALLNALRDLGVKYAAIIKTPVAAAIGAGLDISAARGVLSVCIGGEVTEIAVMSMNGIVAFRSMRTGSNALDEAIVRHIRKEKNLVIGMRTAEDLKCDLADCSMDLNASADLEEVQLRGRDAVTGRPNTVKVNAKDVTAAVIPPVEAIVEAVRDALANTPAELAGDIAKTGIHLSGGGALLHGLPELLEKITGLQVHMTETPQDDAAIGACAIACNNHYVETFVRSGALIEC